MDHLGSVLPTVLNKRGLRTHAQAAHVVLFATEWIVSNKNALSRDIHVQSLQHGSLVVECTHSIVLEEMHSASAALLDALVEAFDSKTITDIRLVRS